MNCPLQFIGGQGFDRSSSVFVPIPVFTPYPTSFTLANQLPGGRVLRDGSEGFQAGCGDSRELRATIAPVIRVYVSALPLLSLIGEVLAALRSPVPCFGVQRSGAVLRKLESRPHQHRVSWHRTHSCAEVHSV